MVTLKLGDKSLAVKQWQLFLKAQRCYGGEINGEFDISTEHGTVEFQKKHHIQPSGSLDFITYCQAVVMGAPPMYETKNGTQKGPM